MQAFGYLRVPDEAHAIAAATDVDSAIVAGGTTLVDLMRLEVMRPQRVVDITALPLREIEQRGESITIGALVTNHDLAYHPTIVAKFPVLSEALLSGASAQIRNMATLGGNLLQRTRCPYFRDIHSACNKREPDSGCAAFGGYTRSHAVLGTSEHCIATNPSDMCVALAALDAIVYVSGPSGVRTIPIGELHRLPADHPELETTLAPGELVTHVELPPRPFASRSRYVKVRDRASFAFALASAAVALDLRGQTIREIRIALGGVATKPWRAQQAEAALTGASISVAAFERAAALALVGAKPQPDNAFKVELAKRTIVRALMRAAGMA